MEKMPEASQESDDSYSEEFDSESFSSSSDPTTITRRSTASSSSSASRLPEAAEEMRLELPGDEDLGKVFSTASSATTSRKLPGARRNLSFSRFQAMEIQRENQLLLNKIMAAQKPISDNSALVFVGRISSSAINRRKFQRRVQEENIVMLRKIQSAKPRVLAGRKSGG